MQLKTYLSSAARAWASPWRRRARRRRPLAAQRQGLLGPGRHDGRRPGQRQARRLDHHHHGGDQRQGPYSFPADRSSPASTRSRSAPSATSSTARRRSKSRPADATADLKLNRARKSHRSSPTPNGCTSLPGTDRSKQFLTGCTGCHTLQRVFIAAARRRRMDPGVQPHGPLLSGLDAGAAAAARAAAARAASARASIPRSTSRRPQFLVDVSLTNPDAKEYEFKTLPRPKGRATRVIITEYDLPRKNAYAA